MRQNEIPCLLKIEIPSHYPTTTEKINVIKALRTLAGLGLKEAKDLSEKPGVELIKIVVRSETEYLTNCEVLKRHGVKTGEPVAEILADLRKLAHSALDSGEDELANEILQLILAEKLRRNIK